MVFPHLSHGDGPLLGERVVVEVEDAEACVVLHGCGQGCYAGVIDAILGHVNLLQAAHQLGKHIVIVGSHYNNTRDNVAFLLRADVAVFTQNTLCFFEPS